MTSLDDKHSASLICHSHTCVQNTRTLNDADSRHGMTSDDSGVDVVHDATHLSGALSEERRRVLSASVNRYWKRRWSSVYRLRRLEVV